MMWIPVILATFVLCSTGFAKEKTQVPTPLLYAQDRQQGTSCNPLAGISTFIVFPMVPAHTKAMQEKIQEIVTEQLKKWGSVNKKGILKQSNGEPVIDLTLFANSATLVYQICDLTSPQGSPLGIVRASLNLYTRITIDSAQKTCSPYIWAGNCFLQGSIGAKLETMVTQSLQDLLRQFMQDFMQVNESKPVFDLQGLD